MMLLALNLRVACHNMAESIKTLAIPVRANFYLTLLTSCRDYSIPLWWNSSKRHQSLYGPIFIFVDINSY